MIGLRRFLVAVFTGFFLVNAQAHSVSKEFQSCGQALKLAGQGRFEKAREKLKARRCPITADLVAWLYLKNDTANARFDDYRAFLDKHQGWPWESVLKTNAERRIDSSVSPKRILSWFGKNPPTTVQGLMRYVQALESTGQKAAAHTKARAFWIQADFGKIEEKKLLTNLGKILRSVDMKKRATRLLNEEKVEAAARLLTYLSASDTLVIKARLALQKKDDEAFFRLQKAPLPLLRDADLAKDYLTWLRKRQDSRWPGYFQQIASLSQKYPEKFWKERYILSHEALEAGDPARAYKLAAQHRLSPGGDYVEAEWFCGWIALRFLNDARRALAHFTRLEPVVKTPISRSRTAYWCGRAYEAMGKVKEARICYHKAAQNAGTFYGQQAVDKLARSKKALVLAPLEFTPTQRAKFESYLTVKRIRLLAKAGLEGHLLSFAYVFAKTLSSPVERRQILALTHEIAPRYAVEIAQVIAQQQPALHREAYPLLKPGYLKHLSQVDVALAHALIRKESKFNPQSLSSAGARGLMQLMPETARLMAAQCGMACSEQQLITDSFLNVKLGGLYLKTQLEKHDYSFPLTLAAYNAGPGTVARWLTRFPDPRHQSTDIIDWIEFLPYSETRNYIHRVLENYGVYKEILLRLS